MGIKVNRTKHNRGVVLSTLITGDTFIFDNRIGVIVQRNGHTFPLDLTTCCQFTKMGTFNGTEISPDEIVVPIEIELNYKVVG